MIKKVILAAALISSALLIASCANNNAGLNTETLKSSNYSYRVKSLVMHFTAVNYEQSLNFLVNEGGGVSSHYLIPMLNDTSYPHNKVKVLQLVDESERAWHAGVSAWQGRTGLNDSSIGIEIINTPECFEREVPLGFMKPKASCIYPDFEDQQIELLIKLSQQILKRNPDISPTAVVGHSDIAPSRKNDPGPRFPWKKLYDAGIGAWYEADTVGKYWQMFDQNLPSSGLLQKALQVYGYGISQTGVLDRQTQDVLGAFQMHFIPWQVNYQPDASTAATLFALLEKYFANQAEQLMLEYQDELMQSDSINTLAFNQLSMQFNNNATDIFENKRAAFIAIAGSGVMRLNSKNVSHADIFINGQKLNIDDNWPDGQIKQYSIAKRTQTGLNTIRIANISGVNHDSIINIEIPYPSISNAQTPTNWDFSKLDTLIENDVNEGFPGAAILVLHKGKVIKRSAYGYARKYADGGNLLSQPIKMAANTLFDLDSNTKVFATTLAIMKLVDEGKLSLNAPIASYLSEYNGEGRDTRTIADLLAHASGYNSDVSFFKADNPFGVDLYSQDGWLTRDILLHKLPFSSSRRSKQTYSDTNFLILGLLVERLVNMPLDEYVETQIYAPLGLRNTLFKPLLKNRMALEFAATEIKGNTRGGNIDFPNIRTHVLQGEVHDEKAFYSMQGVSGHAGLFSNIDDLAVLAQMLLNGGGYNNTHIFSEHTLMRFVHPEFIQNSIGLGWRLASQETKWHFGPYASARAFGHTGSTGTATVIDPELDLAIVYLTNKRHSIVDQQLEFTADKFASAKYGKVMALVYEALLEKQ